MCALYKSNNQPDYGGDGRDYSIFSEAGFLSQFRISSAQLVMSGGQGYWGTDPSQYPGSSASSTAYTGSGTTGTSAAGQEQYTPGYYPSSYPVQYQASSSNVSGEPSGASSYAASGHSYPRYEYDEEGQAEASSSHQEPGSSSSSTSGSTARRRQQNRLAQRALRQRKEHHLRDLESRIINARFATRHLEAENEELEWQLQQVNQENESLRSSAQGEPYRAQSAGPTAQGYGSLAYDYQATSVSEPNYTPPDWSLDDTLDATLFDPEVELASGEGLYGEGFAESGLSAEDLAFYEEWQRQHGVSQG